MKKVALVYVLAVFVPSLVLAWLAVRSLRDQQFLLERQQSLLYQGVADSLAKDAQDLLAEYQRSFTTITAELLRERNPQDLAKSFDQVLRKAWPLAQVGFVVTLSGNILSPSPLDTPEARSFFTCNNRFLANRESAEVYWNSKGNTFNAQQELKKDVQKQQVPAPNSDRNDLTSNSGWFDSIKNSSLKYQARAVVPQQALQNNADIAPNKLGFQSKQVADDNYS